MERKLILSMHTSSSCGYCQGNARTLEELKYECLGTENLDSSWGTWARKVMNAEQDTPSLVMSDSGK